MDRVKSAVGDADRTTVVAVVVLFAALESVPVVLTVAVLLSKVGDAGAVTMILIVAFALALSVPRLQVTVAVPEHEP